MINYSPAIFDVETEAQAKAIILTPDRERSTEHRWRIETPYLIGLIEANFDLGRDSAVLDYGCGIGRMAKALIERFGCIVVGADISPSMRGLAADYVASPRFMACAPEMLESLGIRFDAALAIWVLQHCLDPAVELARIEAALKGGLFVVNDRRRLIPTRAAWVDDGEDVRRLLGERMLMVSQGELSPAQVGEPVSRTSFWATYNRRMSQ